MTARLKILYFAWLRERVGRGEEDLDLPEGVDTLGELIDRLRALGPGYANAFANPGLVRMAVNQVACGPEARLRAGDEVAFFPPVTGG